MTPNLDVEAAQRALDALITGDRETAAGHFTDDLVLTGIGGYLDGRTTGLRAVVDRFADISRLTHGTFGTEVEAVYAGDSTQLVVITRHWASMNREPIHGTQALIVAVDGSCIRSIDALSRSVHGSGIWD